MSVYQDPDVVIPPDVSMVDCIVWIARLDWDHPLATCVVCTHSSTTVLLGAGLGGAPLGVHVRCVPLAVELGVLDIEAPAPAPGAPAPVRQRRGAYARRSA